MNVSMFVKEIFFSVNVNDNLVTEKKHFSESLMYVKGQAEIKWKII